MTTEAGQTRWAMSKVSLSENTAQAEQRGQEGETERGRGVARGAWVLKGNPEQPGTA